MGVVEKKLLLVDKKDRIIGRETKEKSHEGKGILHRAFSVLVFNKKGQILLSQRSGFKKLWPFFWDNTCSSHPLKGQSYVSAGRKRLKEELGFTCPLKLVDKFYYQARYKNVGSENEICALLTGKCNPKKIKPDPKEIKNWEWVDIKDFQNDLKKNSRKYTPWLKIGFEKYLDYKMPQDKENLSLVFNKFTKVVEPVIEKTLVSNVDKKFQQLVKYPVLTGGKRVRPVLAIISCLMLGGKLKDVLYPAAGLEILHNYTLIVDDMIDDGILRRGKPTCWFKFGNSIAQCVGIDYAATIFQTANRSKNPALISEVFTRTIKEIVDGEILDILFERVGREKDPYVIKNRYKRVREKDYYEMISKKTAVLFRASCETGGICDGTKGKKLMSLRIYGFNLGMVFQITDDILDIFGEEKKFKKKIGKDIQERKEGNIVILLALKTMDTADRKKFLKIIEKKGKITDNDIKRGMKLIRKTDVHQKAYQLGRQFAKEAKKSLSLLPQNKWNKILNNLVDYVLIREK